ncbi:hypothetical protein PVL30_000436 [Lodderomyces elongisporus]|uniref:Endonuclease/exonuclease/phosphatase domain-containing protein n=1 Tax=Lodderomyces elongisporus (strain ATCC 11503 / CBS 2605 / JCM 1781 / NBRC 1676 / NRRL YB-4239) TaxID=379508 RepID=A5DSW0_LODEL|nr:uncharacterized protein PVL30_000436 [Lodderomyces elongisporus]EDK42268.1 conserved hypothetical protein [Lodderomyces elongisporus NRRL YB-4239]WLF76732.1 hypothetical protein PVL30_000436 [Lodderomyces elongisporus]
MDKLKHFVHKLDGSETYSKRDLEKIAEATKVPNAPTAPLQVQIYSFNIRNATSKLAEGEKPWSDRKHGVISLLKQGTSNASLPTIIGLQEVLIEQLTDIIHGLGPGWTYFGVGRNDGSSKGEFAPVIYNTQDWEAVTSNTFWLSETPGKPSKSWDAALNRIVTNVVLKNRKVEGKTINFFNTHYDHKGKVAREKSSLLIEKLMKEAPAGNQVLTGDLNSELKDPGYKTLDAYLKESGKHATKIEGDRRTCTGFKGDGESIIDFIWTSQNIPILQHCTISQDCCGCLCSDHRPVIAIIEI